MSYVISVKTSFPKYQTPQIEIENLLVSLWPEKEKHVHQFGESTSVKSRNLTLPLNDYPALGDIGERSLLWIEEALNLQEKNIIELIKETGIDIKDISMIASTTVTGLAIPTLEARLMNRLPFSKNLKRLPIFGLGCLGGVAGLNRVHDYLEGHPKEAVLLLATELCSLTFQFSDKSVANLVGTALFADGAAAVLLVGADHPLKNKAQFKILDGKSFFYPDTERMMGWDIVSSGFQIVLSGDVPKLVKEKVSENITKFLDDHQMSLNDVGFFISHPGGPKVLEAITEISGRDRNAFQMSWDSLRDQGNMSSVSVLHAMEKTLKERPPRSDSLGLMLAMGPAFCSEMAIIKRI